jgi:hypothetical protein
MIPFGTQWADEKSLEGFSGNLNPREVVGVINILCKER